MPETLPQGEPLLWTDQELDELLVDPQRMATEAAAFWKKHAPADAQAMLGEKAGMSKLNKADRDKLPESDFGDPEGRKFPIVDASDVADAAGLIGKAGDPEKVKKRIKAIAKRKGFAIPKAWEEEDAKMSQTPTNAPNEYVAFDIAVTPQAEVSADGKWVTRYADVIFKADKYPGQQYEMTPDEIRAAVAEFKDPVPLEDTHAPSVFNGKLGDLIELKPTADHASFGGKFKVAKWFHDLFQGKQLPLSAVWHRATKRLKRVAVLPNPQIPEAQMLAAFAESEKPSKPDTYSPHGRMAIQKIHDMAAVHGACCEEGKPGDAKMSAGDHMGIVNRNRATQGLPYLSPDEYATFMASHEAQTMQKVHDATKESGSMCRVYATTPQGEPGAAQGVLQEYQSRNTMAPFAAAPPAPAAKPEDPEIKKMREQLQVLQGRAIDAEAAAFCSSLTNKIFKTEVPGIIAAYKLAASEDAKLSDTVTFALADGTVKTGSRIEALKAMLDARPKHNLTEEMLDAEGNVNFNVLKNPKKNGDQEKMTPEERKKYRLMSDIGQAIQREEDKKAALAGAK